MPYFSPMSATDSCWPSRAASSIAAKIASWVDICSLMTSPSFFRPSRSRVARSIEVLLELEIGPGHHALATEEQHLQDGVALDHGAHLADTGFPEFGRDRIQQGPAGAMQTRIRVNRQRKHPAARRRAEFPRPDLANDETEQVRIRPVRASLGHQEEALVQPLPAVTAKH